MICNVWSNYVFPPLSLLFNIKVQTTQNHATLQIFSGSFASMISANGIKARPCFASTGHHGWRFYAYWTGILSTAEKQHVVVINCHLLYIKNVWSLDGDVPSISFIVIMILMGMYFFSLIQTFSAVKSVYFLSLMLVIRPIYKWSENGHKCDRCDFLIDIYGGRSLCILVPEHQQYFP